MVVMERWTREAESVHGKAEEGRPKQRTVDRGQQTRAVGRGDKIRAID